MSTYTQVKAVTSDDRLKLIGLLTLAEEHRRMMKSILRSALTITGEKDDMGHTADAIWSDTHDAGSLLAVLDIEVADTLDEIPDGGTGAYGAWVDDNEERDNESA